MNHEVLADLRGRSLSKFARCAKFHSMEFGTSQALRGHHLAPCLGHEGEGGGGCWEGVEPREREGALMW